MARTTIPAELVAVNAIQGTLIADNAITAVHIATNAVSGTLVADNAITSTHIAQNNVTATQIAQNTITVTQIADSAIETAKINNDAVTQAKIADDAVGPDQLAANAVVSASIANGTIVEADMADNAVTLAKMASLARGSIIVGDSAGDPSALAIGSNDYVLTSDGTDIAWEAASGGLPLSGGTLTGTLNITQASTADTIKLTRSTTAQNNMIKFASASADKWIVGQRNDSTEHFRFYSYGTSSDVLSIQTDGNVGIGTTSPADYDNNAAGISSNLVVKDSGHSGIIVISGTSSDAAISFGDGTGAAAYRGAVAYVNSQDKLYFKSGGSNRMIIDGSGNVGINETSPDFSGFGSSGGGIELDDVGTNFTAIRLSHGATGDFYTAANTGAAYLWSKANSPIVFGTNNAEKMRLDETGRLMVGGTSTSGSTGGVTISGAGYRHMYMWNSGLYFWNGSNEALLTSGGAFSNASDERLKENITDIPYGLAEIKQLKPKKYNMITDGELQIGLIAQEVETIIPEVVTTSGEANMKSLSYGNLNAVLIKAIQEQQTIIDALTARIETLEG